MHESKEIDNYPEVVEDHSDYIKYYGKYFDG